MRLQIEIDGKALFAVGTLERPLTGVHELVTPQLRVVFERLAADLALEIIHYMPNYGDPQYWDSRYQETEGQTFDWLENYESLKPLLSPLLPDPETKVLVLGCGNALFSEALYADGFKQIVNIDISSVVIEQMIKRNDGKPEMTFHVMDARKLEFDANTFDLVVDKSTMDALLCGDDSFLNVAKMTREVQRVLKVGGHYFVVSYGNPENRSCHFQYEHLNWTYSSRPVGDDDPRTAHYCYTCQKQPEWETADLHWPDVELELAENPEPL